MTDITPADLAKFIHPVPVGAVIPAATEHAVRNRDGDTFIVMTTAYDHEQAPGALDRWTAEPLAAPKPPLPTEMGAVIANVQWGPGSRASRPGDTCAVMVLGRGGKWHGVDPDGFARNYEADDIVAWTPARIVTDEAVAAAEPDLMDESDKRPRIDLDSDWVCWHEDDHAWRHSPAARGAATLAEYAEKYARIVGWVGR